MAVLTRVFGWPQIDLVEDMVQESLLDAFQCWQRHGIRREPSAWIHRIARNKIVDALRRQDAGRRAAAGRAGTAHPSSLGLDELFDDRVLADSEVRMIFACGHPCLSTDHRIALVLKTLFAFSTAEAGCALGVSEVVVKKRLQRAKSVLLEHGVTLDAPGPEDAAARLAGVHEILRALLDCQFVLEGAAETIRAEAIRLCRLLTQDPRYDTAETRALLAQSPQPVPMT